MVGLALIIRRLDECGSSQPFEPCQLDSVIVSFDPARLLAQLFHGDTSCNRDICDGTTSGEQSVQYPNMTVEDFRQSLTAAKPPAEISFALAGLWWDAKGDWTRAHESAQQDEGTEGSWVHAYLHRKEGDEGNAAYWYSRAGKPVCREPLEAEWLNIVKGLLG